MATALPYDSLITFVEAPAFTRMLSNYLDDEAYTALQWALTLHPEAGVVIPGSGGVRKMRWAGSGRGKRGGLRVIYYWRRHAGEIWMLTLYAKNEAENIPAHVLRAIKETIES
jgi:mRNA-degrading endonuclease RelE of RelBE toxin-antitoxin system